MNAAKLDKKRLAMAYENYAAQLPLFHRDHLVHTMQTHSVAKLITPESLTVALADYGPDLQQPIEDFAVAMRYHTAGIIRRCELVEDFDKYEHDFERKPTPDKVKKSTVKLAKKLNDLALEMFEMQGEIDEHLLSCAFSPKYKTETRAKGIISRKKPVLDYANSVPEYDRMKACVREMMWLGGWVERASRQEYQFSDQIGQLTYSRDRHIAYAVRWSFPFAEAFGVTAGFSDGGGEPIGNWPDFYCRMLKLTLKIDQPKDFLRVLKEARKRHRALEKDQREFSNGEGAKPE